MESTEPTLPLRDQGELFSPEKEHPLSFLTEENLAGRRVTQDSTN
jgi:hypothetical protein